MKSRTLSGPITLSGWGAETPDFRSGKLRAEVLYKNLNKIGVGELVMTNIPADITMEELQKVAHPHKHSIVLSNSCNDKDYWQKVWLIHRLVQALGFERVEKS